MERERVSDERALCMWQKSHGWRAKAKEQRINSTDLRYLRDGRYFMAEESYTYTAIEFYTYGKRVLCIRPKSHAQIWDFWETEEIYGKRNLYIYGKRILYVRPKSPIYTSEKALRGFEIFERRKIFMAKESYNKWKNLIYSAKEPCAKSESERAMNRHNIDLRVGIRRKSPIYKGKEPWIQSKRALEGYGQRAMNSEWQTNKVKRERKISVVKRPQKSAGLELQLCSLLLKMNLAKKTDKIWPPKPHTLAHAEIRNSVTRWDSCRIHANQKRGKEWSFSDCLF